MTTRRYVPKVVLYFFAAEKTTALKLSDVKGPALAPQPLYSAVWRLIHWQPGAEADGPVKRSRGFTLD